jgi:hypothetical protein
VVLGEPREVARFLRHNNRALGSLPCQTDPLPSQRFSLFFASYRATIVLLSRFSHLVLPSPKNQAYAAMCVQPSALALKVIQYIVLYCLTPPPFHRYSWLILCPPSPAQDGLNRKIEPIGNSAEGAGICLVNRPKRVEIDNWPRTTGPRPLLFQGVHVA